MPMRIFGFIDTMHELMDIADLVVGKAGGLTIAEALGHGVPLILYHFVPGQERRNAEYVVRQGTAVLASSPDEVARIVREHVENPERLAHLGAMARAAGRPRAARELVSKVVAPLVQRQEGREVP